MSFCMSSNVSFIALFDRVSVVEKIRRIRYGLTQPEESGPYKYARAELMHLVSWGAAVSVPIIVLILLLMLGLLHVANATIETPAVLVSPSEPVKLDEKITLPEDIKSDLPDPESLVQSPVDDALPPVATSAIAPPTQSPPVSLNISPLHLPLPSQATGIGRRTLEVERGGPSGRRGDGAVLRALRWLKREQLADGSWESPKPAMTGLALLCFLGRGETTSSEEFGETIQRALKWLLDNQTPDGLFAGRDTHDYSLPIAAYALCEAAALTRHPQIGYAAQRSVRVIVNGQNAGGGWDYGCVPSERIDTSYSGWCVQALKAASIAGMEVDGLDAALARASRGLAQNSHADGGFGYTSSGRSHLTGVGVLCMQLAGQADAPPAQSGLQYLQAATIDWNSPMGQRPIYYWYYITQAMFNKGGMTWSRWDHQFAPAVIGSQTRVAGASDSDPDLGYWDSPAASENYGRVYSTALCTLMLEVYYRYLPSYGIFKKGDKGGEIKYANAPIVSIRL